MWGKKNEKQTKDCVSEVLDFNTTISKTKIECELKIKEIEHSHKLAIAEKEFELKHFKDEEMKKKENKIEELNRRVIQLETENKMLDKIINLNGDIIDVKNLVNNLIEKLPTIDLKSLTINQK